MYIHTYVCTYLPSILFKGKSIVMKHVMNTCQRRPGNFSTRISCLFHSWLDNRDLPGVVAVSTDFHTFYSC